MELLGFELSDAISIVFGTLGLTGLFLAYKQLRLSQKADTESARSTRARFALDVTQWVLDDTNTMRFFYRLDYCSQENCFEFDADQFPHSDDEFQLDRLLYKLTHVGGLVRRGILKPSDIEGLQVIVRVTFENEEVAKYLEWLQSEQQIPWHSDFTDGVRLYGYLFGARRDQFSYLTSYLDRAQSLEKSHD